MGWFTLPRRQALQAVLSWRWTMCDPSLIGCSGSVSWSLAIFCKPRNNCSPSRRPPNLTRRTSRWMLNRPKTIQVNPMLTKLAMTKFSGWRALKPCTRTRTALWNSCKSKTEPLYQWRLSITNWLILIKRALRWLYTQREMTKSLINYQANEQSPALPSPGDPCHPCII